MSRFIGVGLETGRAGVVIATRPHLKGIEERLGLRATAEARPRAVRPTAAA